MKRRIKLFLTFIISIVFVLTLSSCNKKYIYHGHGFTFSADHKDNPYEYGDQKIPNYWISGLTKEGKQQKEIVIPDKLEGAKVGGFFKDAKISSKKLKRVYLPYELLFPVNHKVKFKDKIKVISMYPSNTGDYLTFGSDTHSYFPNGSELNTKTPEKYYANVTYYYNNNTSDIYWIDDYSDELISYIPEDPVYEGHTFAGWYKESECINKWDFENDKVPKKEYESKKYIYIETALYAKWQENSI